MFQPSIKPTEWQVCLSISNCQLQRKQENIALFTFDSTVGFYVPVCLLDCLGSIQLQVIYMLVQYCVHYTVFGPLATHAHFRGATVLVNLFPASCILTNTTQFLHDCKHVKEIFCLSLTLHSSGKISRFY